MLAPSCSLMHSPCDLELETDEQTLPPQIKKWLAFAKQKINEVVLLSQLVDKKTSDIILKKLHENTADNENRKHPL